MEFELNETEQKEWDKFNKLHQSTCSQYTGAIGTSPVQTVFTATSIGRSVFVVCRTCGTKLDITDVGSW